MRLLAVAAGAVAAAAALIIVRRRRKQQLEAAFITAVKNNDGTAIRSLAAAGVDVHAVKLTWGMLPLTWACFTKDGLHLLEMSEEAANAAMEAKKAGAAPTRVYEFDNHIVAIQALIEVGADVNEYEPVDGDFEGSSALSVVSEVGNLPVLKTLLAAGVDVNRPAEIGGGRTALMIAAHMGCGGNAQELKAFINTLLEAGADVNGSMTDKDGKKWQALTSALDGLGGLTGESGPRDKGPGLLEAIRLLLATGKVEQEHLSAARDMAKQMGHREAMELLS